LKPVENFYYSPQCPTPPVNLAYHRLPRPSSRLGIKAYQVSQTTHGTTSRSADRDKM